MSTILGANGQPAASSTPEAEPATPMRDQSETRDVRTVPTGVLCFNLCLCANGLQLNRMTLEQIGLQMQQQKMIVDPPEVHHLKAIMEHQTMARDVMVGELNHRFRAVDAARLAEIAAETPKEDLT